MNFRKSILKNLLLFILITPVAVFSQSDTLELPFFEDWSSGSLDTNGWIADSNWSIHNEIGNPLPSLTFDARQLSDSYEEDIYSAIIDPTEIRFGDIWLDFDIMLKANDSTKYGKLIFYIKFGDSWRQIASYSNDNGSFGWKSRKLKITHWIRNTAFNIRIHAAGDPAAVDAWYIDNLHFYRTCTAPENFDVQVDTGGNNEYQLNFSWTANQSEPGWINWDNGTNYGGVGACESMSAAARWDAFQLSDYDGNRISAMRAFLHDSTFESLVFKIWEGENADSLIYHDTISDYLEDSWIEHDIESNVFIDASKELWVGYSVINTVAGTFPMGVDTGPGVVGFGDMIREECGMPSDWFTLASHGINQNWNIQFYVEDNDGLDAGKEEVKNHNNERAFHQKGYNLYQSLDGGEYELLEFIPLEPGNTTHSIPFEASPYLHCYRLTAIWAIETDTCESAPAISKDNPDEDYVCVLLVGNEENIFGQSDLLRCFPNPFSNATTVEYTLQQASSVQITIFNHLGEQVDYMQQKQSSGKQQMIWDAKNHPAGMYYLLLQTEKERMTGKMMIVY
jgi:hypothetical protein